MQPALTVCRSLPLPVETPMSNTTFADRKAAFLQGTLEDWQADHNRAMTRLDCEIFIRDLTQWFVDLFAAENKQQETLLALPAPLVPAESGFPAVMADMLATAEATEDMVRQLAADGGAIEGLDALRAVVEEARAALAPSHDLPPAMAALARQALADHAAGLTEEWR